MSIETLATFDADFPYDAKWDERGLPLIPGGKAVTIALRDAIENRGNTCSDVLQHSFYGWEFRIRILNRSHTCIVQSYENDQWLLICEPRFATWYRLFSKRSGDADAVAVNVVGEVLNSDSRFSDIRWHQRKDF